MTIVMDTRMDYDRSCQLIDDYYPNTAIFSPPAVDIRTCGFWVMYNATEMEVALHGLGDRVLHVCLLDPVRHFLCRFPMCTSIQILLINHKYGANLLI